MNAMSVWRNNSLSIVLLSLFLLTLAGQALTGWSEHNEDARLHGASDLSLRDYLLSGHFWEATGENWERAAVSGIGVLVLD